MNSVLRQILDGAFMLGSVVPLYDHVDKEHNINETAVWLNGDRHIFYHGDAEKFRQWFVKAMEKKNAQLDG